LTRRPGDLPEGGDETLKNMEQVVLKPHNLLEPLRMFANRSPGQNAFLISDHFDQAYKHDPLPRRIFEATQGNSSLKEITVAEYTKQD
jgi:hypothetical protein